MVPMRKRTMRPAIAFFLAISIASAIVIGLSTLTPLNEKINVSVFIMIIFNIPGIGPVRFCGPCRNRTGTPLRYKILSFARIPISPKGHFFVAPPRFERGLSEPKSDVLPLHHGAIPIMQYVLSCNNVSGQPIASAQQV